MEFDIYNVIEDVVNTLDKMKIIQECSAKFNSIPENHEKVNFVEEVMRRLEIIPKLELKINVNVPKSDEKSVEFRKEGNKYFSLKSKDYYKAMELYNKSLCFAEGPTNSSLAYANRSAILLEWQKYKECLENIRLAKENNYPENLLHKIEKREKFCMDKLQNPDHADRNEEENIEFELTHGRHPIVPYISKCLDIKEDTQYGRYVYTKEALVPGDVVSIEKPFCTVLLPKMRYIRCANCNDENSLSLIPCPNCTSTMYCSSKCLEDAYTAFHKYECPFIDVVELFTKIHLVALRVTLVGLTTFDSAVEFFEFCMKPENQNRHAFDIDYKNFDKKQHYRAIHGTVTNQDKRSTADLFQRAITCCVMNHFLLKYTPMKDILGTDEQKNHFSDILFRHLQTSPSNMHGVELIQTKDMESDRGYMAAAYAFNSLLNHSCAPNLARQHKNGKCYTFVLRPISVNGILFENYGYHYCLQSRNYRQEKLKLQYNFVCNCEACINDYPLFSKLLRVPGIPSALLPDEIEHFWTYDKQFAKENVGRYFTFLKNYAKHYPCKQLAEAEETLKMALSILVEKVPMENLKQIGS